MVTVLNWQDKVALAIWGPNSNFLNEGETVANKDKKKETKKPKKNKK